MPKISSYGHYNGEGYGAHSLLVEIGVLDLYFSYETVVAFRSPKTGLKVRENSWGPTTGKHLNWIDGGSKDTRLESDEFEKLLDGTLKEYGIEQ